MQVVISAATINELQPLSVEINKFNITESKELNITFNYSGVGLLASSVSLTKIISEENPGLIIQAGIAGCFDASISLGKVVIVNNEVVADQGVEEDGKWKDMFDLNLEKLNQPPYNNGTLPNPWLEEYNLLKLAEMKGITINEITTGKKRIQQLLEKYNPVIESMEGAALHYVCRKWNIPFIQIRAFSNYVGERDKSRWQVKEAIFNLNQTLLQYIKKLIELVTK